jgi:hypothetical protein
LQLNSISTLTKVPTLHIFCKATKILFSCYLIKYTSYRKVFQKHVVPRYEVRLTRCPTQASSHEGSVHSASISGRLSLNTDLSYTLDRRPSTAQGGCRCNGKVKDSCRKPNPCHMPWRGVVNIFVNGKFQAHESIESTSEEIFRAVRTTMWEPHAL